MPQIINRTRDAHGNVVFHIRLSNDGRPALILEDDFNRICAEIGNGPWFTNTVDDISYVRARDPQRQNLTMISRMVVEARTRTVVHYHDGNRLNLCRSNLSIERGHGGITKKPKDPDAIPYAGLKTTKARAKDSSDTPAHA